MIMISDKDYHNNYNFTIIFYIIIIIYFNIYIIDRPMLKKCNNNYYCKVYYN